MFFIVCFSHHISVSSAYVCMPVYEYANVWAHLCLQIWAPSFTILFYTFNYFYLFIWAIHFGVLSARNYNFVTNWQSNIRIHTTKKPQVRQFFFIIINICYQYYYVTINVLFFLRYAFTNSFVHSGFDSLFWISEENV